MTSALRPLATRPRTALRPAGLASWPRLVAEVEGERLHVALALRPGAPLQDLATLRCADFDTPEEALASWLRSHATARPRAAALAVPTAVLGDEVRLPGHPWRFSIEALERSLALDRLLVVNDFSALALALPSLPVHELRPVGGGQAVAGAALALVGPGTGLGMSGLLPGPAGGARLPIAGEGGHATLSSSEPDEAAVLDWLQRRHGHVSAEHALSARGLADLYAGCRALRRRAPGPASADDVIRAALAGHDAECARALAMFCGLLGQVAGNLALTLGARGGLYVAGDLVPRFPEWLARSSFRARFEAKGRLRDYLRGIPTWVVMTPASPVLRGACRALDLTGEEGAGPGLPMPHRAVARAG